MAPQNLRAAGDRIEYLLDELRTAADRSIYERAEELLRLVSELYGAGLARVLEIAGKMSPATMDGLVADELVGSLLLVHQLHPRDLSERVEEALAQVRPFLARHDGDVELVDVDASAAAVRIRLLGTCDGCPSSAVTLQSAVERAILEAAPEIERIDVDETASTGTEVALELGQKPDPGPCPAELSDAVSEWVSQ